MTVTQADLHFENISPRPGDNGKEKTKQMRGYAVGPGKRWGQLCPNEATKEMGRSGWSQDIQEERSAGD